jgi:hypothetical protein
MFLFFCLIASATSLIPTPKERLLNAIEAGFSHEPWRSDALVIHWDMSYPREELEQLATQHRWTVRMEWNRDAYEEMQLLAPEFEKFDEQNRKCKLELDACQRQYDTWKAQYPLALAVSNCPTDCLLLPMTSRVARYLELRNAKYPRYDRMIFIYKD